ncbi:SDR family oxidoreductase [Rhodococcus sp. SGAir0479]|uniref:SDR family oxidoreductase n=1 Tax=Rhodococcus sp. SGAir0479 TaxID=2567884 RepID=UPI0010CCC503|nr:SDR family oxidoreductase [Rhodococcus sp. SGAir0479]QCQ90445.1 SDR family oxidoreductase [Rhodococcus sp. SGAir0479]
MDAPSSLGGKVALVTGAGRGIGAATARALARERVRLILVDRDGAAVRDLAAELGPDVAVPAEADVGDLAAMERAVAAGSARFGGIDLVLANAGMGGYGSVAQIDPATFARVVDVNLVGAFNTVRAALPSVLDRRGYILIVSSGAAFVATTGMAAYNASKAGLEHFATTVRLELAPLGVGIGSAHMLWIDTPMVRDARADLTTFAEMLEKMPGPLGKVLPVEDCAAAFVAAMASRKRRVYVPRWLAAAAWLEPVFGSRLAERAMLRSAPQLSEMDRQVAALGRSTSIRTVPTPTESTTQQRFPQK